MASTARTARERLPQRKVMKKLVYIEVRVRRLSEGDMEGVSKLKLNKDNQDDNVRVEPEKDLRQLWIGSWTRRSSSSTILALPPGRRELPRRLSVISATELKNYWSRSSTSTREYGFSVGVCLRATHCHTGPERA
eukprot:263657-Heterocapsa_arctica.AAC.1